MTAERFAAEKLAETLVQVVEIDDDLFLSGDPLKRVTAHIDGAEHRVLAQAAQGLFQRFQATVSQHQQPHLESLAATVRQLALPAIAKMISCISSRRAFQAACTLTPLLNRTVVLAMQCCGLAMRGTSDASTILPFTRALTDMAEVFSDAIIARSEQLRPFDAARIAASHQRFADLQAEAAKNARLRGLGGDAVDTAAAPYPRTLAPPPAKRCHIWRYEQLKHFWDASCSNRYLDDIVPIDALAVLLLQAAAAELSLANREAIMRRLHKLPAHGTASLSPPELDACGPEMRRCGGLKAWIHAVIHSGGEDPPRPITSGSTSGVRSLATTWYSSASGGGSSPLHSARTTGSTFGTRSMKDGKRPFVLSTASRRRPGTGRDESSPLADSVTLGLLKASQRLVLGEKASVDGYDVIGETPLHIAASQDPKHAPFSSLLLRNGANANAEDRHLATPLHVAAATGHSTMAKELVAHGADVRREDRWGVTPLHRAADNGQADLAQLLLKEGASPQHADEWGATPLHRAVARGQLAVAEKLLETGVMDANAEDRSGERPLHIAAARGDYAMVKLLLEHGGEAAVRSRTAGKTPEQCARARGHMDVVTLLQNREEWVNPRCQILVVHA
eukprot:TRINITY_DN107829_c0_g1_i1.p1 TRINITY_DN107829_c0_g1~~TRINITY_DN107829_c0_g1_i1.p1  ORF type:complete len:620 (+),score=120.71 TRINITY_DN107829_c0_g1_i1:27-1886(+)